MEGLLWHSCDHISHYSRLYGHHQLELFPRQRMMASRSLWSNVNTVRRYQMAPFHLYRPIKIPCAKQELLLSETMEQRFLSYILILHPYSPQQPSWHLPEYTTTHDNPIAVDTPVPIRYSRLSVEFSSDLIRVLRTVWYHRSLVVGLWLTCDGEKNERGADITVVRTLLRLNKAKCFKVWFWLGSDYSNVLPCWLTEVSRIQAWVVRLTALFGSVIVVDARRVFSLLGTDTESIRSEDILRENKSCFIQSKGCRWTKKLDEVVKPSIIRLTSDIAQTHQERASKGQSLTAAVSSLTAFLVQTNNPELTKFALLSSAVLLWDTSGAFATEVKVFWIEISENQSVTLNINHAQSKSTAAFVCPQRKTPKARFFTLYPSAIHSSIAYKYDEHWSCHFFFFLCFSFSNVCAVRTSTKGFFRRRTFRWQQRLLGIIRRHSALASSHWRRNQRSKTLSSLSQTETPRTTQPQSVSSRLGQDCRHGWLLGCWIANQEASSFGSCISHYRSNLGPFSMPSPIRMFQPPSARHGIILRALGTLCRHGLARKETTNKPYAQDRSSLFTSFFQVSYPQETGTKTICLSIWWISPYQTMLSTFQSVISSCHDSIQWIALSTTKAQIGSHGADCGRLGTPSFRRILNWNDSSYLHKWISLHAQPQLQLQLIAFSTSCTTNLHHHHHHHHNYVFERFITRFIRFFIFLAKKKKRRIFEFYYYLEDNKKISIILYYITTASRLHIHCERNNALAQHLLSSWERFNRGTTSHHCPAPSWIEAKWDSSTVYRRYESTLQFYCPCSHWLRVSLLYSYRVTTAQFPVISASTRGYCSREPSMIGMSENERLLSCFIHARSTINVITFGQPTLSECEIWTWRVTKRGRNSKKEIFSKPWTFWNV